MTLLPIMPCDHVITYSTKSQQLLPAATIMVNGSYGRIFLYAVLRIITTSAVKIQTHLR